MALWHVPPPFAGSDPCDGAQMETIDQLEGGNSKTANTSEGTSSLFRPGSRVYVVSNTAAPLGGGGMGMWIQNMCEIDTSPSFRKKILQDSIGGTLWKQQSGYP